jgi:hypothetical protein
MKLHVPLRIPATETMRSPAKLSRSARRIGMPPATAASIPRPAFFSRASAWSAAPSFARRSLFAVTTVFPGAERGADERVRGLVPADQLDDEVDVRGRRDRREVRRPADVAE